MLRPETVDLEALLTALAAAALATDDPIGAVDEMREALRGRVLAATLDECRWNINETARRLKQPPRSVHYVIEHFHPELAAKAREKGPPQIGRQKHKNGG